MSFCFLLSSIFSQNKCTVLVTDLIGEYVGDCKRGLANGEGVAIGIDQYEGEFKKGLPHGFGIYKWSTGEIYEGDWNKGSRDGIGEFIVYDSNMQTIIYKGVWEDNLYIGPEVIKPTVSASKFISRYEFNREGDGNRIRITIYSGATLNENIYYGYCHSTSGTHYYSPARINIESVNFPVSCEIHYRGYDLLARTVEDSFIKFEIQEPGSWTVNLYNN